MHTKQFDIRPLQEDEIRLACDLENEGYPEDEAASFDILMYRHKEAPELTVGYFDDDELIAFVSGSRYHGSSIKEESMKMHIPNGETVCIHSVCVQELRRRQGIATRLLKAYTDSIKRSQMGARRILLITHSNLIPLYTRAGFVFREKSQVVHGKEVWYEFEMLIKPDAR